MAVHKNFPKDKFAILDPSVRFIPSDEELRKQGYENLLPPLVARLRILVKEWRDAGYEGATVTSKALLDYWFKRQHIVSGENGGSLFGYYFAQREAVETVVYLYDVAGARNKYDLLRFDASGRISTGMFSEEWLRLVIKMATGSGKTKVISLLIAWAYFHKLYEETSGLARNFLLITPNIIVLERLKTDFAGLKIFYHDPILPENGFAGRNWQDDFQITLHLQDNLNAIAKTGNIFLTNIHRVYEGDVRESSFNDEDLSDYFLGKKPVTKLNDSGVDLSDIVRTVDEIMIINDEAHHIHDPQMAWFKSIQDINNQLCLKNKQIALQIDVTATPKHNNGGIFVQTISDYPLVEAIQQKVVKRPVLPDEASRAKLSEKKSALFTEKYEDYINLGVEEWRKTYQKLEPLGKKAILFIMTDDTRNCDEVSEYLESYFPELKNAVLTIHTNKNGEIAEKAKGKSEEELQALRKHANAIDQTENPYKAIVSVLMLKEGWDVKNVTTIVGLRAYAAKSNILPEQTLGRGLRKMFAGDNVDEYVSVIGTSAFMEFVESIKAEGVEFESVKMDNTTNAVAPLIVEVDYKNKRKNIDAMDIAIPILSPRIQRDYKNLSTLLPYEFKHHKLKIKQFSEQEQREIIFKNIDDDKIHHTTILDSNIEPNYQNAIGFFAQNIMQSLRLFGCYDVLFGKVKEFVKLYLFENEVDLENKNILRNLSEVETTKTIIQTFTKEINALTVQDCGDAKIKNYIKLSSTRPFIPKEQKGCLIAQKSIFNRVIGDNNFENEFAAFLENLNQDEIISFAKNCEQGINFKIDYQKSDGAIGNYYPDFLVKVDAKTVYVIETKGREDLDDLLKIKRLKQWCDDVNAQQTEIVYNTLYIKQETWEKYRVNTWRQLIEVHRA